MADEFVPYIKYDAKVGGYYPTIDFRSLPFPPSNIPELFNLRIFIIETNERGYYLRSTLNSLFCFELTDNTSEIEVPDWDTEQMSYKYDENGEVIYKTEKLKYLSFTYDGVERTVAYNYAGKGETFLQMHTSTVPFAELDERLQKLYIAAKMLSQNSLEFYENEIRKMDFRQSGLKPKGEWEEQMFRDTFQSNTSLMSDDEYEMIFGIER
jgi:hypothetical protein